LQNVHTCKKKQIRLEHVNNASTEITLAMISARKFIISVKPNKQTVFLQIDIKHYCFV